jgi:hypothetical protein
MIWSRRWLSSFGTGRAAVAATAGAGGTPLFVAVDAPLALDRLADDFLDGAAFRAGALRGAGTIFLASVDFRIGVARVPVGVFLTGTAFLAAFLTGAAFRGADAFINLEVGWSFDLPPGPAFAAGSLSGLGASSAWFDRLGGPIGCREVTDRRRRPGSV